MVDFEQVKWAISHDPCRAGDRTPNGAVPSGTIVHLTLRVNPTVRPWIESASVLVGERLPWRSVPTWFEAELSPCDDGYAGFVTLDGVPHVSFYAFSLRFEDGSLAYYVPRADSRATAGQIAIPGPDGEWTELGWQYAASQTQDRPRGDFGLSVLAPGFQITVFDPDFKSPDWLAGEVMYQIFPDRFARGGQSLDEGLRYHETMGRPVRLHGSWDEPVEWEEGMPLYDVPADALDEAEAAQVAQVPDPDLPYDPVDFYGGTLQGIRQKLPYLASLGVEVLYLNPIFESRSNHRYDTADYEFIDPLLGTEDDFRQLVVDAAKLGISIILDAVLSHTGNVSRYFNADGAYDTPGAMQGTRSPYYSWYDFEHPGRTAPYRCWWGDPVLPEVDERNPSWQRYMFGPQGTTVVKGKPTAADLGVLPYWLAAGARGYRLDVADEIPDDVLERIRTCVKSANSEAAIIGEVWEDATTKASYGEPRSYALGGALDSVMNYPLRAALIGFALGNVDAHQLVTFLKLQKMNYPAALYRCLMNLLSSHDVERVRSALALGRTLRHMSRADQLSEMANVTPEKDQMAAQLQRMIAALMYMLPGVPCLYYGDEVGLHGGGDPFCRATFPWEDEQGAARLKRADCGVDLTDFYQRLGTLRKDSAALKHGAFACSSPSDDVLCLVRVSPDKASAVVAVTNRSAEPSTVAFDASSAESGLPSAERWAMRCVEDSTLLPLTDDQMDCGAELACEDGILRMTAPPLQTVFWHLDCGQ